MRILVAAPLLAVGGFAAVTVVSQYGGKADPAAECAALQSRLFAEKNDFLERANELKSSAPLIGSANHDVRQRSLSRMAEAKPLMETVLKDAQAAIDRGCLSQSEAGLMDRLKADVAEFDRAYEEAREASATLDKTEGQIPAAQPASAVPATSAPQAGQPASTVTPLAANGNAPNHWWTLWEGKQIRVGDKVGYTDECFVATDSPAAALQEPSGELRARFAPLPSAARPVTSDSSHPEYSDVSILDKGDEVDVVENEPRDHSADALVLILGGKADGVLRRFFRSDAACQIARQADSNWRAAKAAEAAAADRRLDKYR